MTESICKNFSIYRHNGLNSIQKTLIGVKILLQLSIGWRRSDLIAKYVRLTGFEFRLSKSH